MKKLSEAKPGDRFQFIGNYPAIPFRTERVVELRDPTFPKYARSCACIETTPGFWVDVRIPDDDLWLFVE